MLKKLAQFWRSKTAVAAVEFGLIAPVLGTMLVGTIELCNALECRQKATGVVSSVADLVAQTQSVSASDMSNIFNAANEIMYPFPSANAAIVVSSIVSDGNGNGTVAWSVQQNSTALTVNSAVTVPTGLMAKASCAKGACSVIFAQITYTYTSPLGKLIVGTLPMTDYFYARPRESTTVAYTG